MKNKDKLEMQFEGILIRFFILYNTRFNIYSHICRLEHEECVESTDIRKPRNALFKTDKDYENKNPNRNRLEISIF